MPVPIIRSGKFHAGADLVCGENVVVDVAEEVVVGDRCVLPDNAYLGGRRVTIGNDFYGYSWEWRRLDVGRGRRDEEDAVLTVGDRCTFHDNKIDLARAVTIDRDVGLSPEVTIYTHYYWQSPLEGFPVKYAPVVLQDGAIIGYRSLILPGVRVGDGCVVGAHSVVAGDTNHDSVYAGNPANFVRAVTKPTAEQTTQIVGRVVDGYLRSRRYRGLQSPPMVVILDGTTARDLAGRWRVDLLTRKFEGHEDADTDDLRWHLFRHGFRVYTLRPFRALPRRR